MQLVTCYHGTNETAAAAIRVEGLRARSWFAFDTLDAEAFGGPVIFAVEFPESLRAWNDRRDKQDRWQFMRRKATPASALRELDVSEAEASE